MKTGRGKVKGDLSPLKTNYPQVCTRTVMVALSDHFTRIEDYPKHVVGLPYHLGTVDKVNYLHNKRLFLV